MPVGMPSTVSLRNSVEHAPDGEWGLFDRFRSYAAMPNSSAMKVAWAIASSWPPISLCPSESYSLLRFLAVSARRLRMSRTLSPATSASSPCDGFALPHYSGTYIDGDEPDREEHLLPSTPPPQPDRPGSCPR